MSGGFGCGVNPFRFFEVRMRLFVSLCCWLVFVVWWSWCILEFCVSDTFLLIGVVASLSSLFCTFQSARVLKIFLLVRFGFWTLFDVCVKI